MPKKKFDTSKINAPRALTASQQKALLARLDLIIKSHGGSQKAAARTLGISQQVVNQAVSARRVGVGLGQAIARDQGSTVERIAAEAADRWPIRTLAVPLAREDGVSEERIAAVLALPYDGAPDVSRVEWVRRMKAET